MNEPFDSSEQDQPMRAEDPSSVEQQLQAFRPRAPQVNWDEITSVAVQALPHTQLQTQLRPGFTIRQMSLAIAASWIIGAVVGGGCIFWSMSSRDDVVVQADTQPNSIEVAASPSPELPDMAAMAKPASSVAAPAVFNLGDASWPSNEPLSVRSGLNAVKSPSRLTSLRGSASSITSSDRSHEPAAAPTPISNRQQLMREYLENVDKQIY